MHHNQAPSPAFPSSRIAVALLRGLALTGALFTVTAGTASARFSLDGNYPPSGATDQTTAAVAPETVVKETVVKPTAGDPALPIVLSAVSLTIALGAAARTLTRPTPSRNTAA
jgi:hypothetical protein